jgi:hypothetical protein
VDAAAAAALDVGLAHAVFAGVPGNEVAQPGLYPGGVVEDEGGGPVRDDLHLLHEPLGEELDLVGGVVAHDVGGGIVADAIVAPHLLALEVKVEDGGLVGAFSGEGEGRLTGPTDLR